MKPQLTTDCYHYPQYWDLAFRSETRLEADFVEAASRQFAVGEVRRLLEPGCGGGRLIVELAARGYQMVGLDLHPRAVAYVRQRLRRRQLPGQVFQADMTDFDLDQPVDAALNTMNTFRHLTTEEAARSHLRAMARAVRPGGIYVLGFHLLPPDADEEDQERWSARHGQTEVHVTLRVLDCDRERRLETIRFVLRVRSGQRELRIRSDYPYRLYTAGQVRTLLKAVPEWELCGVYDFWYELDHPVELNDELGDMVLVLRRK